MTTGGDIIYVVHGSNAHTWWRRLANGNYPWWRRWSLFCWELRRAFGHECEIREFRWTGGNTHEARLEAGRKLANIIESEKASRKIHIVGHSHGGNVALAAVNQLPPHAVDTVVLLANPNMALKNSTGSVTWLYWGEAPERVKRVWNVYSPDDIVQCRLVRRFPGISDSDRGALRVQATYDGPAGDRVQNGEIRWAKSVAAHRALHSGAMGAVVGFLLRGETFTGALKSAGLSAGEANAVRDRGGWPGDEQVQQMIRMSGSPEPFELGNARAEVGILFLHGFTASPAEMRAMAESMAQGTGWRCKGILLPGHGTRVEDMEKVRAKDWVLASDRAYEELAGECRAVFIVGLSMGAVLACQIALHRLSDLRLRGLILLAPAFGVRPRRVVALRLLRPITNLRSKGRRAADYFLDNRLYSYLQTPLNRASELLALGDDAIARIGKLRQLPVLMFVGDRESTVSLKKMLSVAHENPWIRLVRLPRSRHILTVEPDRELVFDASTRFVEECLRKA